MSRFAILALLCLATPALAADKPLEEPKPKVEVVSVGEDGKPDVVRVEGFEMKVCKGDVKDGCINPQDAGFDWGGPEINYWPGRPASEIDEPLPVDRPSTQSVNPSSTMWISPSSAQQIAPKPPVATPVAKPAPEPDSQSGVDTGNVIDRDDGD